MTPDGKFNREHTSHKLEEAKDHINPEVYEKVKSVHDACAAERKFFFQQALDVCLSLHDAKTPDIRKTESVIINLTRLACRCRPSR